MIRHRVHMIISASCLKVPTSFRTDVLLTDRDTDKAYEAARDQLTEMIGQAEILSHYFDIQEV